MGTFTVTNTNDSGKGSLRQAILESNANSGADTIEFDASLSGKTINLSSGELTIEDDLNISGDLDKDGIADITVDANQSSRILNVDDGRSSDSTVSIEGLIFTGGRIDFSGGSGIYNAENLTIDSSTITDNVGVSTSGVGVDNVGTLKLNKTTISGNSVLEDNNSTYSYGGGIRNSGDLVVANSTISGNQAGRDRYSGGGAIANAGTVEITSSTLSGNDAIYGEEILSFGASTINSSTILGTVFNNAELQLSNSIVSEIDTNRAIQTRGVNLVENGGATGALTLDPKLTPLQNNGGPTQTHAPLEDSPVLDLGDNKALPADVDDLDGDGDVTEPIPFDQRGKGFDRIVNGSVDVGAVEGLGKSDISLPDLKPSITVDTLVDENDFDLSKGDISLREAIAFVEDGGIIDFDSSLNGGSIILNSSLTISKTLKINGLGADQLTIDANDKDRVFLIDDGNDRVNQDVAINDLTITGGLPGSLEQLGRGAGLANRETLSLSGSHVTGNFARGNPGGGIYNYESGILAVSSSTISENTSYFSGGGIFNRGELTVSNSTVSENDVFYSGNGGGIFNSGTATIVSSTISGNIDDFSDADGITSDGETVIQSSIVDFVDGSNISAGNSLIEDGAIDVDLGGNVLGQSAELDPDGLQNNGGSTPTIALQSGSPAIDSGSNPGGLDFDQRGIGFDREVGSQADIGAFEVQDPSSGPLLDVGLYDADSDELIAPLEVGGSTILASAIEGRSLSIAALVPDDSPVADELESVFLDLNQGEVTRTENSAPYSLFGDRSGDFAGGPIPTGKNTVSFDLYSEDRLRGDLLGTVDRSFTIADDLTGLDIGLFDADTDERITTLFDGAEIDASQVEGRNVNIAAVVPNDSPFAGQVESMFLNLNQGEVTRTENGDPYALFGNSGGNFFGGSIPSGENTISFDLYSEDRRKGELLDIVSIGFSVV